MCCRLVQSAPANTARRETRIWRAGVGGRASLERGDRKITWASDSHLLTG